MAVQQLTDSGQEALEYITTRNLITSVGVAANATLTKTDVEHLLVASGVLEDISNWVLADLLVWGESQVNENVPKKFWEERDRIWGEMLRFCKKNISKSAAYHLCATAKAWPYERRRSAPCISFEHHRLLSGYPVEQQEYWMDVAEAGEWSSHRLRHSLDKDIDPFVVANTTPPLPPLWTIDKFHEELEYRMSSKYDIGDVFDMVEIVIGEYEHDRQARGRGSGHP